MRKVIVFPIIFFYLFLYVSPGQTAQDTRTLANNVSSHYLSSLPTKIDSDMQAILDALQDGEMTSVIVTMRQQTDLSQIGGPDPIARQRGVIQALQATANSSQGAIISFLAIQRAQGLVSEFTPLWVFNGLSITATREIIQELASRSDVATISSDQIEIVPSSTLGAAAPEANISTIQVPDLWNLGFYGQGIVVANMDSGVDVSHPDLATRWRGGSNSWFDPYYQHSVPVDISGHGTWTMGVMVGGDAGGTSVGIAPQAQWVAVKIFNDAGSATATAIHQGFQWLLDPDGNPNTADAPHVVNNSWTFGSPGCNLEFQLDLRSLRAAGILPVFAAGNYGPYGSTSVSPANYPEVVAVGAVDNNDQVYALSSRGPSACGEAQSIYPELVAPGVNIYTTDLYGFYTSESGTSLAAPHVTGALALLLNAFPNLSADQQSSALINGALDLGSSGADNNYGFGRLDVMAAYQWLQSGGSNPTPSPTPDPNVNLALSRPVTVSSSQDSAHAGAMAVDGDLATYWQTARASGKNKLPSEWITIDLGAELDVGRVVLDWDANFATAYSLMISSDNSNWTSVFNTTIGDGGIETITVSSAAARYIKLDSTAWSSGSQRIWLKEIQVYSGGGTSSTPTPTPTPSATPTPIVTTPPPGAGSTMHIGDLDGSSAAQNRRNWAATITVWVHDSNELPMEGASVSGNWSGGASGTGSCITAANGSCQILSGNVKNDITQVLFTVTDVGLSTYTYQSSVNHDPDGDSDGTSITISAP